MSKYKFEEGMRQISGFGGGYEATCQNMVIAGLEWFDKNQNADPKFKGWKDIVGVIDEDNEDAKALSKIVIDAAGGDCTGAMHQFTISHILWIHNHSWEEYVAEMKRLEKGEK